MSEYFFENLEKIEKINKADWLKEIYSSLEKIRIGEDYLFFHMKDPISKELGYYRDNVKELNEVITILDEEYAVCGYHQILDLLLSTEEAIEKGNTLEYLIFKEEREVDGIVEKNIVFYTFPEGVFDNMKKKKENELISDKKRSEGMYL